MIKLSKTSKMPGASWSLPAMRTCPGAWNDGVLAQVCAGCYATDGFYNMPTVQAVREHNLEDWKRAGWVDDMVKELDNLRYFRWYDSGDCYHIKLAEKMLEVMKRTPWVKHWFPTRMNKFKKFHPVLLEMQSLENVMIRPSADDINPVGWTNGSIVCTNTDHAINENAFVCPAPTQGGKCDKCRACWDKSVPLVAYATHGQKMKKVIKINKI